MFIDWGHDILGIIFYMATDNSNEYEEEKDKVFRTIYSKNLKKHILHCLHFYNDFYFIFSLVKFEQNLYF